MNKSLGQIIDIEHRDFKQAYYANNGYIVPTMPKHGWNHKGAYTLNTLQKTEKEYSKLTKFVNENLSHLISLQQDKELARNATARILGVTPSSPYSYTDNPLFTFHLQNGRVFNFPYLKISQAFNLDLEEARVATNNGGDNVNTIIGILKDIQNQLNSLYPNKNLHARHLALVLYVRGSFNDSWTPYIESDLTMDELIFAFEPALTRLHNAPLPLEHVRDWVKLPREWVLKMISEDK